MHTTKDAIQKLLDKEKKTLQMGGEKAIEKQKQGGKLTARERLDLLFDIGTFRELDMFVAHRCDNFGMEKIEIPSDGVITGHGLVNGRPVFAFSQDFTSRGGSLGEMHAAKICKVMDMALKSGVTPGWHPGFRRSTNSGRLWTPCAVMEISFSAIPVPAELFLKSQP